MFSKEQLELFSILQIDWSKEMNELNIPPRYKGCSTHIALERADMSYDKDTFDKLINRFPFLEKHIELTKPILSWNFR